MTFGEVVEAINDGHHACRSGWNGKGMWICLTPGSVIPLSAARAGAASLLAAEAEMAGQTEIRICPHIDMKAADGSLVVGWLASQTDMLATDWMLLSKPN